ncbi:MAG: hypothetical protein J3R72DRAFT_445873 [Linnemannia gamsii]|nr:MAG: hypothetical protein J3R72DRAFT_445866 [Linnemannia gamsii]KAK3841061.1 MAG: hypothetical protein J3R72DRAFT_445873 [Linnemannia gamsii]
MLDRTPNLKRFMCDARSWPAVHRRTLCLEDLLSPGFRAATHHPSSPVLMDGSNDINSVDKETELKASMQGLSMEEKHEKEYIQLSALKSFLLIGPWTVPAQVLETLFAKVFPQVEFLCLQGCVGFTPAEWVNSTSSHLHWLKEAWMSSKANQTELVEAGLTPGPDGLDSDSFVLTDRPQGRIVETSAEYLVLGRKRR